MKDMSKCVYRPPPHFLKIYNVKNLKNFYIYVLSIGGIQFDHFNLFKYDPLIDLIFNPLEWLKPPIVIQLKYLTLFLKRGWRLMASMVVIFLYLSKGS